MRILPQTMKPAAFIIALCVSAQLSAYENYPVINSNEVLSSKYLSSPYHRVESVDIENGFYRFDMESDFGRYTIYSKALFKKRVDEVIALGKAMNQFERENESLSEELRSELTVTGDSAVDILSSPFSTASKLAGQITDNLEGTFTGENPYVDSRKRYSYQEPKDPTTASHKRNIAFQTGLDLYSNYSRVQSFLNKLANERSAGRVSAGVGLGDPFSNASSVSQLDRSIQLTMKTKSLDELRYYHQSLLQQLRVRGTVADSFIEKQMLSPAQKTRMLVYLNEIKQVNRLGSLVDMATQADNEVMAAVFVRLSKALYRYYHNVESFSAFFVYKDYPAVITNSRKFVYFNYYDLLAWSENNENKFKQLAEHASQSGYSAWRLISLGDVTAMAGRNLQQLEYEQQTNFLDTSTKN